EIIHDLAPDAILGFCGPETSIEFIDCARRLRGQEFGADVIVDDLGFPAEPYFEDGPIALDAAAAVAGGVLWASSAGNDGDARFYTADYQAQPLNGDPDYDSLHDFGLSAGTGSDTTNAVSVPPGSTVTVFLQWSDPFGASANDYDLFLLDAATQQVLAQSIGPQDGNDDPIEAAQFENTGNTSVNALIVIARLIGAQNRRLKLFGCLAEPCRLTYASASGQIYGHPAVPGVIATAAIDALDPGQNDIEPFSSRGPVEILIPAPELRQKPDIAGIDGVSVTGAGGFPSTFFGTSAASPHIGALLALLLSGFDGDAQTALLGTAVDLGAAGRDTVSGTGRADVMAAARGMNRKPTAQILSPVTDVGITAGDSVLFEGECADPENQGGIAFAWDFGNSGLASSAQQNPGALTFANAGTFTVTFSCSDAWGVADSASRTITVAAPAGGGGGAWSPGWLIVPTLAALAALRRKTRAA
ncbi:MAG: S8 family serine peptidase, partial [Gammaproteobacteria bacterium]